MDKSQMAGLAKPPKAEIDLRKWAVEQAVLVITRLPMFSSSTPAPITIDMPHIIQMAVRIEDYVQGRRSTP